MMQRLHITIIGCVQGVGFRPFIYRLANQYHLAGHIRNTNSGVEIVVQGDAPDLSQFQTSILASKPERATIAGITVAEIPLQEPFAFEIKVSDTTSETTLALLPDTAVCDECLRDFSDPTNRRYHYPFVHCTTCGPRFSLFERMPFDRASTTMVDFPMCDACLQEYTNPHDRRFYSQTNCCPQCGPKLALLDNNKKTFGGLAEAAEYLRNGHIIALKNTGGYLLLTDATNEQAVQRLRQGKRRAKKPFALLMPDLSAIKRISFLPPVAEAIVTSHTAPIVLLRKTPDNSEIAPSVSFESPYHGIMLPHNAIQYFLMNALQRPLVATSGNQSGRPICITEDEAFSQLSDVADFFLIHNRRITHRLDDSVVQIIGNRPMLIRRARGYTPYALHLPTQPSSCILAAGSHLKNSFALSTNRQLYISQYIGDLDTVDTCTAYEKEIHSWEKLLALTPLQGVGDLHPDYYSTIYLHKRHLPSDQIQHHKAHVWSGMLDNQLSPPFLGVSWDGTGLGEDQTIWGGESFTVDENGMDHFATIFPFLLPGSERAIQEPRRSALGMLHALFGSEIPSYVRPWLHASFSAEELAVITTALHKKINSPVCSSIGRLFDGVGALLGLCFVSDFEGEAALSLEGLALQSIQASPRYVIPITQGDHLQVADWRPMVRQIIKDKLSGIPLPEIAYGFHRALAESIVSLARIASREKVLITGGVMQNKLLADNAISLLKEAGFTPFWHQHIPPNDGGIAVGQIMGAASEIRRKNRCV